MTPTHDTTLSDEEQTMGLHYTRNGIATFDATTEKIFRYMSTGNHRHAAFKAHHLVRNSNGMVTVESAAD